MAELTDFLEDYDSAVDDVQNSNYNVVEANIERWLETIDDYPEIAKIASDLEKGHDFKSKMGMDIAESAGRMAGSANLYGQKGKNKEWECSFLR